MRKNVLIVEDDPILRDVAVAVLADAGFGVMEAPTAEAALHVLQAHEQDIGVVFTDVNMPGRLDGLALAQHVMALWPEVKVIVTSGNGGLSEAAAAGAAAFLPKPWRPVELLATVAGACASIQEGRR